VQRGPGKVIRDPVHGDIFLSPLQIACLDTREVQRLRGIRQLGTAYLVYPSAQHTRFEHSLGTLHMAATILDALEDAGCPTDRDLRETIGVAALLHDIGHIPFGHTLEDERRVFPRHDEDPDRWRHFLEDGELGELLRHSGQAKSVQACLTGSPEAAGLPSYAAQVVRDTVCADLLDYLKRDAYFCGLSQRYDDRLFRYFRTEGGRLHFDLLKGGLLRPDALSEIVNLLRLRYTLSERVYYHHTKIASGALLSKAVELAVERGLTKNELFPLRDESLLHVLRTRYPRVRSIRSLVESFEARRIPRAVYLLGADIGAERQADLVQRFHVNVTGEREKLERRLARQLGAPPESVIVYCPAPGMALKEADVPVRAREPALTTLGELGNPEIGMLQQKHRSLWRFYVFLDRSLLDHAPRTAGLLEEMLGIRNELPGCAASPPAGSSKLKPMGSSSR